MSVYLDFYHFHPEQPFFIGFQTACRRPQLDSAPSYLADPRGGKNPAILRLQKSSYAPLQRGAITLTQLRLRILTTIDLTTRSLRRRRSSSDDSLKQPSPTFPFEGGLTILHSYACKYKVVENKHKCSSSTSPLRHLELARVKSMGDCKSTNLGRDRLRSVDRNNKTTLLLTRRCGTNKSYAKDLSPRMVKLQDVS